MIASRVLAGGETLELLPLVDVGVVGVSGQLVVPSGSAQLSSAMGRDIFLRFISKILNYMEIMIFDSQRSEISP